MLFAREQEDGRWGSPFGQVAGAPTKGWENCFQFLIQLRRTHAHVSWFLKEQSYQVPLVWEKNVHTKTSNLLLDQL